MLKRRLIKVAIQPSLIHSSAPFCEFFVVVTILLVMTRSLQVLLTLTTQPPLVQDNVAAFQRGVVQDEHDKKVALLTA
jgi:hypothetical protein